MRYTALSVLLCACIALVGTHCVAQEKWSMQKAIAYAQEHNLQIKQAQVNAELSESQYLQSKLGLLPNLNGSANYGVNFGKNIDPTTNQFVSQDIQSGQLSLTSAVTLFSGFSKINEMRSRHFAFMASRYAREQAVNDIALAVANAYLQVLFANELVEKSNQNLTIAQRQLQRMQMLYNAGSVAEGSLFEIQAFEAGEQLNKVNAENQRDLALLNLQQLLDLDKPIDVELPTVELTPDNLQPLPDPDAVFTAASQTYPAVLSATYNMYAAEKGLSAAQGRRYPSLSGFVNLSTSYSNAVKRIVSVDTAGYFPIGIVSGTSIPVLSPEFAYNFENTPFGTQFNDNFGQAIGLSLNIPLFNGWSVNSGVRQSRLQFVSSQIALEQQRNSLQQDIRTAYTDANAAAKRFAAAQTQVNSSERAFQYAETRFNAGAAAALDFDQARRNFNAAQSDLLQAKYDYIFRLKILDYYQGKPLTLP